MKQISKRKQREPKNSTPQVEVVSDAMFRAPMHPREQVKGFADVARTTITKHSAPSNCRKKPRVLSLRNNSTEPTNRMAAGTTATSALDSVAFMLVSLNLR
jgi:hypothetical protein